MHFSIYTQNDKLMSTKEDFTKNGLFHILVKIELKEDYEFLSIGFPSISMYPLLYKF